MKRKILLFYLAACCLPSFAQKSELNNNYYFKSGVYLSYLDFVSDSPSYNLKEASIEEHEGNDFNFKSFKVTILKHDSVSEKIKSKDIWGVCVDGIPYINCEKFQSSASIKYKNFSRIQTIGTICFFGTKPMEDMNQGGHFYSPTEGWTNGPSFPKLIKDGSEMQILNVRTGEMLDFKPENLTKFISDDTQLTQELDKAAKPKEKMLSVLRKYNELHPSFL